MGDPIFTNILLVILVASAVSIVFGAPGQIKKIKSAIDGIRESLKGFKPDIDDGKVLNTKAFIPLDEAVKRIIHFRKASNDSYTIPDEGRIDWESIEDYVKYVRREVRRSKFEIEIIGFGYYNSLRLNTYGDLVLSPIFYPRIFNPHTSKEEAFDLQVSMVEGEIIYVDRIIEQVMAKNSDSDDVREFNIPDGLLRKSISLRPKSFDSNTSRDGESAGSGLDTFNEPPDEPPPGGGGNQFGG